MQNQSPLHDEDRPNLIGNRPELGPKLDENALDQELKIQAIADAQARLLKHLCRLVAESWREQHMNSLQSPNSPESGQPQEPN